jgi:adenine-specific DNA methylase
MLEEMPTPTWRAQFLAQARTDPEALALLEASARRSAHDITVVPPAASEGSRAVMHARAGLVANMAIGVLARHEQKMNEGSAEGSWGDIAYFLIDAAAGMIDAPITYTGPVPRGTGVPLI